MQFGFWLSLWGVITFAGIQASGFVLAFRDNPAEYYKYAWREQVSPPVQRLLYWGVGLADAALLTGMILWHGWIGLLYAVAIWIGVRAITAIVTRLIFPPPATEPADLAD